MATAPGYPTVFCVQFGLVSPAKKDSQIHPTLQGLRTSKEMGNRGAPSARDYAVVGIPFDERWKRLDEAIQTLRALWNREGVVFRGNFYNTEGITLEPFPAQEPGPSIWVGSWGAQPGWTATSCSLGRWVASVGLIIQPRNYSQVVAYVIGDHSGKTCRKLWQRLPAAYRRCRSYRANSESFGRLSRINARLDAKRVRSWSRQGGNLSYLSLTP